MKMWGHKIQKITAADPDGYRLTLRFQNGVTGTVSLGHIFDRSKGLAADILKGGMFENCFIESGAVAWPNGFELCPDALYAWLLEERKQTKKAA